MKKRLVLIILMVVAFAVFAAGAFRSALTPYVTFAEAAQRGGSVQVSGLAHKDTARVDAGSGMFLFDLTDRSGQTMPVQFGGAPPGNFDEAESVVVVGNLHDGVFEARKILVKCPSKYQAK
ncbi:MAG: Cytochrome c-type biogenesis protein CcmE [Firmicutes bacterium ADurb.BinA052]|nr:MAG: Cytochrome c-type biogenesis protein CcmE [Firmicutes bacterium ADurb.BinA052]